MHESQRSAANDQLCKVESTKQPRLRLISRTNKNCCTSPSIQLQITSCARLQISVAMSRYARLQIPNIRSVRSCKYPLLCPAVRGCKYRTFVDPNNQLHKNRLLPNRLSPIPNILLRMANCAKWQIILHYAISQTAAPSPMFSSLPNSK